MHGMLYNWQLDTNVYPISFITNGYQCTVCFITDSYIPMSPDKFYD